MHRIIAIKVIHNEQEEPSFHIESFVSAGPRKTFIDEVKEGDVDLGEDITGFLVAKNTAAFWVMDGTSGQDILKSKDDRLQHNEKEYFSSRLLAQNIAWNLHQVIRGYGLKRSSFELLNKAIEMTREDWQETIDNLNKEDREALHDILTKRRMVTCSTTIAFGILSIDKKLNLTISGDCVVITHPNTKEQDIPDNKRRQTAIILLENNEIKLDFNMPNKENCTIIYESGIEKVVAMSDGISKITQEWIASNPDIDFLDTKTRETLAKRKQNTQDDKSLTIVQIINPSKSLTTNHRK